MRRYLGLRGTSLNVMISIIAGLDFLYGSFVLIGKFLSGLANWFL